MWSIMKSCKTTQVKNSNKVSKCESSVCQVKNQQQLMNLRCLCTILNLLQIEGPRHYGMSRPKLGFVVKLADAVKPTIEKFSLKLLRIGCTRTLAYAAKKTGFIINL